MSFNQPRFVSSGWIDHRRSLRILHQRQLKNGGIIIPAAAPDPNVFVWATDINKKVAVYVDLENDSVKSAWEAARKKDDSIGCFYVVRINDLFVPRHTPLSLWEVSKGDTIELVSIKNTEVIKFCRAHPDFGYNAGYHLKSIEAYRKWAQTSRPPCVKSPGQCFCVSGY